MLGDGCSKANSNPVSGNALAMACKTICVAHRQHKLNNLLRVKGEGVGLPAGATYAKTSTGACRELPMYYKSLTDFRVTANPFYLLVQSVAAWRPF